MINNNLLQLNIHLAMARSFELQQIFLDLTQKYEGDFIFDQKYIAEAVTNISESMEEIFFHVNSISGGQNIALYNRLDELKDKITGLFGNADLDIIEPPASRKSSIFDDELSSLLNQVMDLTIKYDSNHLIKAASGAKNDFTANELLIICLREILGDLENRCGNKKSHDGIENYPGTINKTPVFYPGLEKVGKIDAISLRQTVPTMPDSEQGIETLISSIDGVMLTDKYYGKSEDSNFRGHYCGLLFYSLDNLTLYIQCHKYKYLIASGTYDFAKGSYIYFMVDPTDIKESIAFGNQLMERLLEWLDFRTFKINDLIVAGIKDLTRVEVIYHLGMLGKLLAFVSAPKIRPQDELTIRKYMEIFLENII